MARTSSSVTQTNPGCPVQQFPHRVQAKRRPSAYQGSGTITPESVHVDLRRQSWESSFSSTSWLTMGWRRPGELPAPRRDTDCRAQLQRMKTCSSEDLRQITPKQIVILVKWLQGNPTRYRVVVFLFLKFSFDALDQIASLPGPVAGLDDLVLLQPDADALLGRDRRAMRLVAEVRADLAVRRRCVLAGQVDRQHARVADCPRLRLRLERPV